MALVLVAGITLLVMGAIEGVFIKFHVPSSSKEVVAEASLMMSGLLLPTAHDIWSAGLTSLRE